MKQSKFLNFSNTLSPRSLGLQSKASNLFNTQKISPNSLKKSPSPSISPRARREFICNLENIDSYRKQNKLTFTGERATQINQRLEIDSVIYKNFEKRIKTNKLMINDGNNPFTNFLLSSPAKQEASKKPDIIGQVKRLRNKITTAMAKQKLGKKVTPIDEYVQHLEREKSLKRRKNDKSTERKRFEQQQVVQQAVFKDDLQLFEELVSIKEESFFSKKRREMGWNIFHIINDKDHGDFRSNREILQKYYFSQDSMSNAQISQGKSFQDHCLDEISVFARNASMVNSKKHANMPQRFMIIPGDIRLNVEKLNFNDLMMIATGRLTSFVLLKYFREEDIASKAELDEDGQRTKQKMKQQQTQKVMYNSNSANCAANFNLGIQDRGDIGVYQNSDMSELQLKQQWMSTTIKEKYRQLVREEAESMSNTVKDKKLLQVMQKQRDKVLLQQLETNADPRIQKLMKEVDRRIRLSKMGKNRTEKIKVNLLIDTLKISKELKRSKEKSMNTWR